MTHIPENLLYTKDHEWILIENGLGTIGITDFAQNALGDIVFIELPEVGITIEKDRTFGVVESIKSVSDLYAPLTGEVLERNQMLIDSPEQCNSNPYSSWMLKIKIHNQDEIKYLLSNTLYKEHCTKIS